mgnify:FL=1
MKEINELTSRNDLADFLEISRGRLTYILYIKKTDSYYKPFKIPKKCGEDREISAPTGDLKFVQIKLLQNLIKYQETIKKYGIKTNISHGFEKNKSIITNATIHRNKRYILNIDLQNFFDSFHFGRVRGFFLKNKYLKLPLEVATVLAQLTCYKGVLPQGAPTSPIITNFICRILDNRLLKIAKKYKLDYTRYADDLSFSTNDKHFIELYKIFIDELKEEIEHSGFHINDKKTRLLFKDSRQTVTGLIVNKNLNVSQEYYRKTRAMAHALYVKGTFTIDGKDGTLNQLEGRFSFINQLVLYNNKLNGEKHTLKTLTGREREFQRFLFYKYFYCNDYPIIMTEGKTDIRYLKAALKTLHASYPNLIEKEVNDKFKFYIYFFKRTKRIKYFLGLHDGGDNLGSICNYFISMEKDTYPNYFEYFSNIGIYPQKPIILLFDNELESNRPLKKFITKFAKERIHELKNNLWIKLKEEMNIYIVTNDLVDNLEECEIEQLFPEEIRNHKIGGKTFCLKEKEFSPQKNYGKEIFSSYIMSQRDEEVFSGFRDVLNRINSIVTSYTPYAIKNT